MLEMSGLNLLFLVDRLSELFSYAFREVGVCCSLMATIYSFVGLISDVALCDLAF